MARLTVWLPLRILLTLAVASILQNHTPNGAAPARSIGFRAQAENIGIAPQQLALNTTGASTTTTTSASATGAVHHALSRLLNAAKHYRTRTHTEIGGHGRWLLEPKDIHRALYLGDQERIRNFVRRMATGENVTIALLGGSVSKGMGAVALEPSFENWLQAWLNAVAPPRTMVRGHGANPSVSEPVADHAPQWGNGVLPASSVRIMNAACPATSSAYMNMCLREYIQDDHIDLILLEYAINDPAYVLPPWENEARKSFEQLIRKLLRLPRRPAVVLLNLFRWYSEFDMPGVNRTSSGLYSTNAEADFFEFATYYGLPLISLKAATYHQMRAGVRGFQVHTVRFMERSNASADPVAREALFFEDPMHPSGLTGHRVISELIIGMLLNVARGLLLRPWRQSESEALTAPLPPHLIPGNVDSQHDRCLLGDRLRAAVVENQGFAWLNEGRNPRAPKWGFTATQSGAFISFALVPRNMTLAPTKQTSEPPQPASSIVILLAYLRSYEGMGLAEVSCGGDCTCGADNQDTRTAGDGGGGGGAITTVFDGHWGDRTSQLQLGCFPARVVGPGVCLVRVRVTAESNSGGGHKVKLGGLIVGQTAPSLMKYMCSTNLEAARDAAGYWDGQRH